MATNHKDETIEIHWDERSGYLSLACGEDAFERFRQVVKQELKCLPEISVDQVVTVEISDTRKIVARRDSPRGWLWFALIAAALFAIVLPWIAGIGAIMERLAR